MQNKIMGHKKFMDKTNVGSQIVLSKNMLILKTILFQKDFNPKKVSVYKSFRSKHFGYKKVLRLKNVWSDQSRVSNKFDKAAIDKYHQNKCCLDLLKIAPEPG